MRIGTIGSGSIVDLFIEAIKSVDGAELYSVFSRTQNRAQEFAQKHDAKCFYYDMDAFLSDPDLDTVYIASPNALHFTQAKAALLAGKNVILEKPFTSTALQARQLFELAKEKEVFLMEAITVLHMPAYQKAKNWLSEIGPVRLANFNYSQYSSRYDLYLKGEVTNIFDPALEGGALRDINVYNLHAAVGLFGIPESATYYPNKGFNGVDCSGTAVLAYPGMVVTCMGAKDCGGPNEALLEGEKGTITASPAGNLWTKATLQIRSSQIISPNKLKTDKITPVSDGKMEEFSMGDLKNRMTYELIDFLTMVQNRDWAAFQYYEDETLQVMQVLDMLVK